jgi:hypothetical protein
MLEPLANDCLEEVARGTGGGPIDVRFPVALGLGLDIVTDGFLVTDGVLVLGVEEVDGFRDSCFVGDFVGDYDNQNNFRCNIAQDTYSNNA